MATIYNNEIPLRATSGLKLAPAIDKIPIETSDKIILGFDLNKPVTTFNARAAATNATATTIFTCSSTKDSYITHCSLSSIKDVTSTSTKSIITAVIDGATKEILEIAGITLTADSQAMACNFSTPIKVDRSSVISVRNSTAVANVNTVAVISGFEV